MDRVLKKLGYKGQERVLIMNAPEEILQAMEGLLPAAPDRAVQGRYQFILFFAASLLEVQKARASLAEASEPQGHLWIAYPKKSSRRIRSDLSRDILWDALAEFGFEPVSNIAIDEDWSSVRFRPVEEIRSFRRKTAATAKGKERIKE